MLDQNEEQIIYDTHKRFILKMFSISSTFYKIYKIQDTITKEMMSCNDDDYKLVDLLNFWQDVRIAEILHDSSEHMIAKSKKGGSLGT